MDPRESHSDGGDGGGGPSPGESSVSQQHDPEDQDVPDLASISVIRQQQQPQTQQPQAQQQQTLPQQPPPPPPRPQQQQVLSLEQIQVTNSSNEYTEGPSGPAGRSESPQLQNLLWSQSEDAPSPSPTQRSEVVRAQPKGVEELKPLSTEHRHWERYERCPDCCPDCCPDGCPDGCPDCCPDQKTVEYVTCVCCVKALFYHCSSDDEETCSDKPFSCAPPHRCMRWSVVSLLTLLFPCMLCYLPLRIAVNICKGHYGGAAWPRCCRTRRAGHVKWDT